MTGVQTCALPIYTGFNFMISGYDVEKREKAKEWVKNIILMIILVQSSYFFYQIGLEISSMLTTIIYNKIDPHFFMITADNIVNMVLELFLYMLYQLVLFITVVLLIIRFCLLTIGIVLLPIGIFLYFIPPVNSYGKMIISYLFMNMFISVIISIILMAFSVLIEHTLFESFKIVFQITAFMLVSYIIYSFSFFTMMKSAVGKTASKVYTVTKTAIKAAVIAA